MSMKLNISILGEKDIGKTTLINDYINVNNFQKKKKKKLDIFHFLSHLEMEIQ